jgi:hypothetical protein
MRAVRTRGLERWSTGIPIERMESLRSLLHFKVLLGGGAHHAQIPEELVDVGLPPLVVEVHEATDGRTSCSVDQDVQPPILTGH